MRLDAQHIAIPAGQLGECPVDRVTLKPLRPSPLLIFEILTAACACRGFAPWCRNPTPSSSERSFASSAAVATAASSVHAATSSAAADRQAPRPLRASGICRMRASLAGAFVSGQYKRSADVALGDAGRVAARLGSIPSRCCNNAAIASSLGVWRLSNRQRDRIVATTSSGVGAQRIHTVRGRAPRRSSTARLRRAR